MVLNRLFFYLVVFLGAGPAHAIEGPAHVNETPDLSTGESVQSNADLAKKLKWWHQFELILNYTSWEERSKFYSPKSDLQGKSVVLAPCLGGEYAIKNALYSTAFGGCYMYGTAHSQIEGPSFDNGAKIQGYSIFAKAVRRLSESGSGAGMQIGFLGHSITATLNDGTTAQADHLEVSVLAIGRLQFPLCFLDFKGGSLIGEPSALWSIELGVFL